MIYIIMDLSNSEVSRNTYEFFYLAKDLPMANIYKEMHDIFTSIDAEFLNERTFREFERLFLTIGGKYIDANWKNIIELAKNSISKPNENPIELPL